jgi:hypothetical protein
MYTIRHFVLRVIALLVVVLLAGCGQYTLSDPVVPAPVTLTDTSPGQLEATVGVTLGGYDAATRDEANIAVQFLSKGRLVRFQKGETLACNGGKPQRFETAVEETVPLATIAGKPFRCTYTSGQKTATLQFSMPSASAILSPSERANIVRSAHIPIQFQASGPNLVIVALGQQDKAVAQITSAGVATVDTSGFRVGVGSLVLTANPVVANTTAPAFATFTVFCTTVAQADVMWR